MSQTYRFGDVEVAPDARRVRVRGKSVAVTRRAFDILLALIERRERIVTKDELFDLFWPEQPVEENSLHVYVSILRRAIGPAALVSVPGLGFRFVAPLAAVPEDTAGEQVHRTGNNLPPARGHLTGREAEIEALCGLLREHRLVTVVGAGGVGKSRLAVEAARCCVDEQRNGVCWVDLAGCKSGMQAIRAIAAAAGIDLAGEDPLDALAGALATAEMLLVLETCERLVEEVARTVVAILSAAPGVRILATSREALRLPAEAVFRLQPLEVPHADAVAKAARASAAVQLLERRLRERDPAFRLRGSDIAHAVALCRRLDGLPLAIELAAACASGMGLAAMNKRLADSLDLLKSPGAGPARHRSLRASLDWDYGRLTPAEQAALRRLSALEGSFPPEAARSAIADGTMDDWASLDILGALVDKCLVTIEAGAARRCRLPETVRLYARGAPARAAGKASPRN